MAGAADVVTSSRLFPVAGSAMATAAVVPTTEGEVVDECIEPRMRSDLEILNEDIDSNVIEEELVELAASQAHGRPDFAFLEEDPEFQKVLAEGGANPSIRVDRWAMNRLNSFREFKGLSTAVAFYDLSDTHICDLLKKFFEQTCKLDGSLYPSQSLMSMYRAYHRIMLKQQQLRIIATGNDEPMRSLKDNPIFMPVGMACVMAMKRSRTAGANLPRKKATVISLQDEKVILTHSCTSIIHPRGLQKRAAYYMLSRFCIRGGMELFNVLANDFRFGVDAVSRYVRYDERNSKNYQVSLTRFQEEHFRPAITEYDTDVIETLEQLIVHLPTSVPEKERFLFYQAIDNPRTVAWYSCSRVASRNLGKWLKLMHDESGLISDGVTNKSGRTTCVTRMAAEGVPPNVGMLITGHKNAGSYARYDRSTEAKVRAAQKCVAEGSAFSANVVTETILQKDNMIRGVLETKMTVNCAESCHRLKRKVGGSSETGITAVPVAASNANMNSSTESTDAPVIPAVEGGLLVEAEPVATEGVNIQTTEEYDRWAEKVNWEAVEGDLASRGLIVAKNIVNNQIKAVFGQIRAMSNCNVTINFGSGSGSGNGHQI